MADTPVRFSAFTARVPDGDTTVWFHSATGAALRLPARQAEAVERLLASGALGRARLTGTPLASLLAAGFLVDQDDAEYDREHAAYLAARDGRRNLLLTVAPTLGCNLSCSYCFQRELPPQRAMRRQVADGLVDLVGALGDTVRPERLAVQWFGGEPLLALGLMLRCTEGFREHAARGGFEYGAEMLTNGLLLQRESVLRDLAGLHLVSLQISLDGLPATYAARKEIPVDRAVGFYEFLAGNVARLADLAGRVVLRVNVDRRNVDEACEVVDYFAGAGAPDPRLVVRLGRLGTVGDPGDCAPHDCLGGGDFSAEEARFLEHLAARGFATSSAAPQPLGWTCGAVLRHHYAVDPSGGIGRCVPLIGTGEHLVTVVRPGDTATTLRELTEGVPPFGDFDPYLSARCGGCDLLPVCLGGCPRDEAEASSGPCPARGDLERRVLTFTPR